MWKYLHRKDVPQMILNCYPEYKGQKIRLVETDSYSLSNYWDGGSRSYCKILNLGSGQITVPLTETTNPYQSIAHSTFNIPDNHAVVEHVISCGKDAGLFIFAKPQNLTKFLPTQQKIELTPDEARCLEATKKYKASYGGVSRRQQVGMSTVTWEAAQAGLMEKGLMKKNGSLTIEGKNHG